MNSAHMEQMLEQGGTVIILGMPEKTEFGIDLESWNVGYKFKGIKMIPPGLHFIYFSSVSKYGDTSPRTGFFHWFEEGDIIVKNYDSLNEDLFDEEDVEKINRIKLNIRDFDSSLGPYPFKSWKKWVSFTQHIDKINLDRLQPLSGKIRSVPELTSVDNTISDVTSNCTQTSEKDALTQTSQETKSAEPLAKKETSEEKEVGEEAKSSHSKGKLRKATLDARGLPCMVPLPGTNIRFCEFPKKPHKEGATPSEISRGNIDSSYTIDFIFKQLDRPESILAELQFSFTCFLVGQVYDGFEHWRQLMMALCKAEESLIQQPLLYSKFLSILHHQIQEVPTDLFADIVENNNFVVSSLRTVFANITDNASQLPTEVVSKARRFREHLSSRFSWNLMLEEEDEDQPVVVEL